MVAPYEISLTARDWVRGPNKWAEVTQKWAESFHIWSNLRLYAAPVVILAKAAASGLSISTRVTTSVEW